MTEWRIGRGWRREELRQRLDALADTPRNFTALDHEMTAQEGWNNYFMESVIARDEPGDVTRFDQAARAVVNYRFSDPRIVRAYFDPAAPLLGRRMLLDVQALGLHYLCPVVVNAVRDEEQDDGRVFGFRYDTLEGHIETGVEWFLLRKAPTGEIHFRIDAIWRRGQLPNWWSRIGFTLLVKRYQREWHRRAQRRMAAFAYGTPIKTSQGSTL